MNDNGSAGRGSSGTGANEPVTDRLGEVESLSYFVVYATAWTLADVAGLRRVIEPSRTLRGPGRVLVSSEAGYVLHLVPGQPDAVAFEQQLARARQLRKNNELTGAVTALEGALGLWRGVAFAGVPGPFAETERARLAELRSTAAEERADWAICMPAIRSGKRRKRM